MHSGGAVGDVEKSDTFMRNFENQTTSTNFKQNNSVQVKLIVK